MTEAQLIKKGKLKVVQTYMGLFDFTVLTVFGDYKEVCKFVSWKFDEKSEDWKELDSESIFKGRCFFKKGYVPIIWVHHKPKTAEEYATLAHESIHAVFKLFQWVGIRINEKTEELMTHATAHIVYNSLK